MQIISTHHPRITLQSDTASSTSGLDVMIKLVASGRTIPLTESIAGNSGTAFFGPGSIPHRTIWCVVPAFNGGGSHGLLTRALLQGLQRAAVHDLQKVGIELAPVCGSVIPAETVATLVVRALRHFVVEAFPLEEFRLIVRDPLMFKTAKNLIFQPGD